LSNKIKIVGIRPGEKIHELMVNEEEAKRTFEFKNNLIITSQIEKYQEEKYEYLENSKKVDFKEYSSKNSIIEGEELNNYIEKIKPIFDKEK